jgi:hypothetical protein
VEEEVPEVLPVEKPYNVEWEDEVDTVGRKILICESGRKIRLPFHEIEFDVVAGSAVAARLDQIGADNQTKLQIGVPFPIFLAFEDANRHSTMPPTDLEEVLPEEGPLVRLSTAGAGTSRRHVGLNLRFESEGLELDGGGRAMIKNVVIYGTLKNWELRVSFSFRKTKDPRFHNISS